MAQIEGVIKMPCITQTGYTSLTLHNLFNDMNGGSVDYSFTGNQECL